MGLVRNFDGVDDTIVCSAGALGTWTFGTWLTMVKRNSTGYNGVVVAHNAGGSAIGGLEIMGSFDTHRLGYLGLFTDRKSAFQVVNADGWVLVGASKATGSQVCRFHKKVVGSGVWTHEDVDAALANGSQAVNNVRFGNWESGSFFAGRLAVAAVWREMVLSDGQVEGLESALQAWADLTPTGLWAFNQAATTDPVLDLTGDGADQASITGTTVVVGDDPPGFDFTLGGAAPSTPVYVGLDGGTTAGSFDGVTRAGSFDAATVATGSFG